MKLIAKSIFSNAAHPMNIPLSAKKNANVDVSYGCNITSIYSCWIMT